MKQTIGFSTVEIIMERIKRIRILRIMCIGIFFVLSVWVSGQVALADEQDGALIIIGNPNLSGSSLSQVDLQNIFLGKKKTLGSIKVSFVILKNGDLHKSFLKEYLSRTPSQYKKYWKKMVFTGKGKAPKVFKTEEALIEHVQETEGVIGYISSETAKGFDSGSIHQFTTIQ